MLFHELLNDAIATRPRSHPVYRYNPKLEGRALAESLGVRIPAMLSGPGPIMSLQCPDGPFVLKPAKGHSARGVLCLTPDGRQRGQQWWRDLLTGKTHTWGRWRELALKAKKLPSITEGDHVGPPWWLEELLGDGQSMPMEWKFYCFADGTVPLVRQKRAVPGGYETEFWAITDSGWSRLGLIEDNRKRHARLPPPTDPQALLDAARAIGKEAARPFIRVDMYEVDGVPYFGEVTPEPSAGKGRFTPAWERRLGQHWAAAER